MRPDRHASLRLIGFGSLLALGATACMFGSEATSANANESDVSSVANTDVKAQTIPTCWLYSTAGWAESLHKGATGREVDLSEAYWTYWY